MKKKILITVPILIIIIVAVLIFFKINNSKKELQDNINKVDEYYSILKEYSTKINDIRKEYSNLINETYYLELNTKEEEILKVVNNYTSIKNETISNTNKLNSLCKKKLDKESTKKCKTYNQTIESLEKYYKEDIDVYNNLVEKYNENNTEKLDKYNSESNKDE